MAGISRAALIRRAVQKEKPTDPVAESAPARGSGRAQNHFGAGLTILHAAADIAPPRARPMPAGLNNHQAMPLVPCFHRLLARAAAGESPDSEIRHGSSGGFDF